MIVSDSIGYGRDLAYIAGLVTVTLLGPKRPSLDVALAVEARESAVPARV